MRLFGKKQFLAFLVAAVAAISTNGGAQTMGRDKTISSIEYNSADHTPTSISFSPSAGWKRNQASALFSTYFGISGGDNEMRYSNSTTTKMDVTTDRFDQYYKGLKVDYAGCALVIKNNIVNFATANVYRTDGLSGTTPAIDAPTALDKALQFVGAEKYMWQDPAEEARIKTMYNKPDTSFLPKGQLVWVEDFRNGNGSHKLRLAWSFDIYATQPLSRQKVYIDAATGIVLLSNSLIKHTAATGHTLYSGVVPFITSHVGTTYELFDSTRGNGVHTLNMHNGTSYGAATEFTSATNTWPSSAADTQALDAHWGGEIVYDYWKLQQGRLSWDNLNGVLLQYVHYSNAYDNAFWDGTEMNYGDGSGCGAGGFTPLVSLDVTAHEIGHGVCQATCNLVYAGESGGIDEGLSDCWGATIENWGNPHEVDAVSKKPWWMGEEIGCGTPLRRLDSPKLFGLPDTYLGTNWYTVTGCTASGANDQCGVHTNMGVLSKWYYLLTAGGTGTNDLGSSYSVSGQGWTIAANILYQSELALSSTTTYPQARTTTIATATTLYGACSAEVQAVTDAWYAVGVGTAFVPCIPQIGFTVVSESVSELAPTTACPASKVLNIGVKAIGPAITGGSPSITLVSAGGTAVLGTDYTFGTSTVTFAPGDTTTHYATINLFDNGAVLDNKVIKLAFTLAAAGSDATISPTNDTMVINVVNDDNIPNLGGVEYHTLNAGTLVTSNNTSAFYASRRRAHSQFLLNASEMTAAGVRPGVPISQIGFNVTTKNSTIPFTGYTISMGNTTATDLSTAFATPVSQVYTGNPSSNLGLDTLDFNTATFTWDGTSNVAVEVCFGQNATGATGNDQMDGIQQATQIVADWNSTNTGAGTGCTLGYSGFNQSTARPVMRFKQVVPPTKVETVATSTRTWNVYNGTEVYFYNPTDTNVIAGLKNIDHDLGCVTATVTQQGKGFTPATFASVNRSKKEFSITPTINTTITTYDAIVYFTDSELNGVAAGTLYLLKTDQPTDATITAANSVVIPPASLTLLTGTNYVGFKGTFTGFSRYFLIDGPLCTLPTTPVAGVSPAAPCSGTTGWYSVGAVTGATSYTWTVTGTGWSGTSTTDSVLVTIGTGVGTITATASNVCGAGPAYTITVNPLSAPGLPTVTLPTLPCSGGTGSATYTAASTGATSYNWSVSGTGWGGTSTTASLNATIGTGSGTIIVNGVNGCGAGPADTVIVSPSAFPAVPTLSLIGSVCIGATSAVYDAVSSGATSFAWTVIGTGWSGSSTTSSVTLTIGTGTGMIICSGINACGTGPADTVYLTPSSGVGGASPILATTPICAGGVATFVTSGIAGATSYVWTVTGTGWSGTSTSTIITVTVGTGPAILSVYGENSCGAGSSYTLNTVDPTIPPTATFSVAAHVETVGTGDIVTYTGTGSTSGTYSWNFGGGTALPGIGAGPHSVSWGTTGLKTISLTVTDSGCSSTVFTDTVLVVPTTGVANTPSDDRTVAIQPNPSNGIFNLVFDNIAGKHVTVRLVDMEGRVVYAREFDGITGNVVTVNTSDLANSVYTATIVTDDFVINKKVIIAR